MSEPTRLSENSPPLSGRAAADVATLAPVNGQLIGAPGSETLTLPPSGTLGGQATPTSPPGFAIERELGRGGMGVVYLARQHGLNRAVALKMVLSGAHASPQELVRFLQEGEAVAQLRHPNVVQVYEVGSHEGRPYMVLEFCDGGSLERKLGGQPIKPEEAAQLVGTLARAVQAAHDRGIVHRDLKPQNVLFLADGTPKVTDFGLAKLAGSGNDLTASGAIMGTPSYMAPEQAEGKGKQVGPLADVYALGVILYEALTGRPPFRAATPLDTILQVVSEEPVHPRLLNPQVPKDLETIAIKCLQKDPARRYPSATALADDLARWSAGESIMARPVGRIEKGIKWVKRNPTVAGMVSFCVVVLLAGASISTHYAIQASMQAKHTAAQAERAFFSAREATASSEQAKDALCRGTFEQARSLRLAGQSGWRDKSLELLQTSAELRARIRLNGEPPSDLPALVDMRTEAVLALQRPITRLVRELPGYAAMPMQFSQDGRRMIQVFVENVETRQSGMSFVDLTTGREISRSKLTGGPRSGFAGLFHLNALNHDGTRAVIVGPTSTAAQIHEIPSLRVLMELRDATTSDPKDAPVTYARLRYSPDGSKIAAVRRVGNEAQIVVWDAIQPTTPRVILRQPIAKQIAADFTRLSDDSGDFAALRFTGDSKRLSFTAPDRKTYRVVDLTADPPRIADEIPISIQFHSAEWHPSGEVLSIVESDGIMTFKVSLWDVQRRAVRAVCGEARTLIPEMQGKNIPLAFSPNGQWLAIGGSGSTVQIYGGLDGTDILAIDTGAAISFGVNRLLWTADNELVSNEFFGGIKIWRIEEATDVISIPQLRPLDRPAFSPDGRWLAVFAPSGKITKSDAPVGMRRFGTIFDRDRIALIDRKSHQVARFLPGFESVVGRVFFSPDSQRVVVHQANPGEGDEIVVRSISGEEVLRRKLPKEKNVRDWSGTFYDPTGLLLSFADVERRNGKETRHATVMWDVVAEQQVAGFPEFADAQLVRGESATSPDGSRLLVGPGLLDLTKKKDKESEPRVIRLFEIASGKLIAKVPVPTSSDETTFNILRIGTGGHRALNIHIPLTAILTGKVNPLDIQLSVRDLTTGEQLLRFQNRSMADDANDFSADNRLLAVGAEQGYVDLWDVDAKVRLFRWQPHGGKTVQQVTIAPDGDIATVAETADRLVVLRMAKIRAKLTELGLGW